MQTELPLTIAPTSLIAGKKTGSKSAENKKKIMQAFMVHFHGGATSYEMAEYLNKDHGTVQPRFCCLRDEGKIVRTNQTRLNPKGNKASVWRLA